MLHSGRYEVVLMFGCGAADVGGMVQVKAGGQSVEAKIHQAYDPMPVLPRAHNRSAVWTSGPVPVMTWIPLAFKPMPLEKGAAQLVVRTSGLPANSRFELKEARLRRVE